MGFLDAQYPMLQGRFHVRGLWINRVDVTFQKPVQYSASTPLDSHHASSVENVLVESYSPNITSKSLLVYLHPERQCPRQKVLPKDDVS